MDALSLFAAAVMLVTSTRDVRGVAYLSDGRVAAATTGGVVLGDDVWHVGDARGLVVDGDDLVIDTVGAVVRLRVSDGEERARIPVGGVSAEAHGVARWRGAVVVGRGFGLDRPRALARAEITALASASDGAGATDAKSVLWVATRGAGLWRWDGTTAKRAEGIGDETDVYAVAADARGAWVATADGLVRVDVRGRRVSTDEPARRAGALPVTDVRAVVLDGDAPVIGTFGGGAWRWDGTRWSPVGPIDLRVQALAVAPGGGEVALGTTDGLAVVVLAPGGAVGTSGVTWLHSGGLPANDLSAVAATTDGGAWVGTASRGVARVDEGGKVLGAWASTDGLLDDRVTALAVDDARGGVWIATERGLDFRGDAGGFHAVPPYARHLSSVSVAGGRVFCGAADGLWTVDADQLVPVDGFPLPRVTAIGRTAAKDGMPRWVGTADGLVLHADDGTFRIFTAAPGELPDSSVAALVDLPDGAVLVRTTAGAFFQLSPSGRTLAVSPLAPPEATSFSSSPSALWIATPTGLLRNRDRILSSNHSK